MSVWHQLEGGTIVRVERDLADTVTLWVTHPPLRVMQNADGEHFVLRLSACTLLEYTPVDEPPLTELAAIAASQPVITQPTLVDDVVELRDGAGTLRVRYEKIAVTLDNDQPADLTTNR